jgi:DNA-binding response OmpR family regulator
MRILVIEDEKEIAMFLKKNLKNECFVVDVAASGDKGLLFATTNEYDIVILDYILPVHNGLEVCRMLRQAGNTVPIIILSVKSNPTDKTELLNAGADDYLAKPFSFDELLARIWALLRRPAEIKKEILKLDDLILDPRGQTVQRGNSDIYLTRKEFALLHYLMKNQGTVLSRAMILEHVWDMNADPFSYTIESHIRSLRRKLDVNKGRNLIHTVSGRGYKMK